MKKQGNLIRCGLLALVGMLAAPLSAYAAAAPSTAAGTLRIVIQTSDKAEMPAARFNHEKHVAKLGKAGAECVVCHTQLNAEPGKVAGNKFAVVPAKLKGDALKDAWHAVCMDCHKKQSDAPADSACRTCHDGTPVADAQLPVKFGRSLHAKHIGSSRIQPIQPAVAVSPLAKPQNCGACHDEGRDAKTGMPVYRQNTEDASTFFGMVSADKRALAAAAHDKCVSCHRDVMKADAKAPKLPIACADCHSADGQAKFPQVKDPCRLFRGQEDTILMASNPERKSLSTKPEAALKPVPFNHLRHENVADCSDCHGMKIEKKEKPTMASAGVSAATAAHAPTDPASCVGCHAKTVKTDKKCSGCHGDLPVNAKESCVVCHNAEKKTVFPVTAAKKFENIAPEDVPETVTIEGLSKDYKPVQLPHRKIYASLLKGLQGNALADAFHAESVCKACHHLIPNDNIANPPSCVTCHDKDVKAVTVGQAPSLKSAYHQLCISCHANMDVKPVAQDCAGCHEPVAGKNK